MSTLSALMRHFIWEETPGEDAQMRGPYAKLMARDMYKIFLDEPHKLVAMGVVYPNGWKEGLTTYLHIDPFVCFNFYAALARRYEREAQQTHAVPVLDTCQSA